MLISLPDPTPLTGCVLSIGNFDGVHVGHQQILATLVSQARVHHRPSCVLTFEPHPIHLLRPEFAPPRLTTVDQKKTLILSHGVDHVIVYPTDADLLNLSAKNFFDKIIVRYFQATALVEGPNFFFGKGREGTIDVLKLLCSDGGVDLTIADAAHGQDVMISSSEIRESLRTGDIASANAMLGWNYSITGEVTHGAQRGREIGFPTCNLSNVETLVPGDGVYAAWVEIPAGSDKTRHWKSAVNIGPNPTFGENSRKIEVHLLDYQGDLYGQQLTVHFSKRIRNTVSFGSVELLRRQIDLDIAAIRDHLSQRDTQDLR